jgi:hypothetical protein
MLRKGKVKEMLRNRIVYVMLNLGKGMIKITLSPNRPRSMQIHHSLRLPPAPLNIKLAHELQAASWTLKAESCKLELYNFLT